MALRQNWRFTYTARDLIPAVRKKAHYHADRVRLWKRELGKVADVVGDATEDDGYPVNMAVIEARERECRDKLRIAKSRAREYALLLRVLKRHPKQRLDLDVDDITWAGLEVDL